MVGSVITYSYPFILSCRPSCGERHKPNAICHMIFCLTCVRGVSGSQPFRVHNNLFPIQFFSLVCTFVSMTPRERITRNADKHFEHISIYCATSFFVVVFFLLCFLFYFFYYFPLQIADDSISQVCVCVEFIGVWWMMDARSCYKPAVYFAARHCGSTHMYYYCDYHELVAIDAYYYGGKIYKIQFAQV